MLLSIGKHDLTDVVQESSYSIDSNDVFEEWLDGNFVKHRIVTRQRVVGSLEVALYGKNGIDTAKFLEIWNSAVNNNVVTVGVWVTNINKFRSIDAYYTIKSKKHRQLSDGAYVDILLITLEEK